jgi:hypothetical protein
VVTPVIFPVFELMDQLYVEDIVLVHVTGEVVVSEQIVWEAGELLITGNSFTVTKTVFVLLQIPSDPVSVYVIVELGFAVTVDPVVADKLVFGLQV